MPIRFFLLLLDFLRRGVEVPIFFFMGVGIFPTVFVQLDKGPGGHEACQ